FNDGTPMHYDSGLRSPGATFPEIRTEITRHVNACFDTVFTVDAKPSNALTVGDHGLALVIGPNPSSGVTEVMFALPAEGPFDLGVFDLAGRAGRVLEPAKLPAGPHFARWDGSADNGERVASGLYVVRLTTTARTLARTVVRVR